ncbi:MAG: hypothetical protein JWO50_537 [Candidatus Kaiserbacteria bacterium]|nr:hypothetical protein [Candidatus Kaiserbacteria bacterium]
MIIQATIEHMKTRPHQERKDFAAACSFVIVAILFLGWLALFVHNVQSDVASQQQTNQISSTDNSANGANALTSLKENIQSSTDSFANLQAQASPGNDPQIINIDTMPQGQ